MSIPTEIAWYKCDDDAASTTVSDETGNHDGATASENTEDMTTTGRVGKALVFDGNSDRNTSVADHADFDFSGAFWITAWIKPTYTDISRFFLSRWVGGYGYHFGQGDANDGCWRCVVQVDGMYRSIVSDAAPSGQFQHVAMGRDASGYLGMYIDGVKQAATEYHPGTITADNPLMIGSMYNGSGSYEGILDDVRIYAEDLTPGMIQRIVGGGYGTGKSLAELYAENDGPLRNVLR